MQISIAFFNSVGIGCHFWFDGNRMRKISDTTAYVVSSHQLYYFAEKDEVGVECYV